MAKALFFIFTVLLSCVVISYNAYSTDYNLSISGIESEFKPKIIILPFKINSLQDVAYLKKEVPEKIAQYLEKEGAIIAKYQDKSFELDLTQPVHILINIIRERKIADYVIWGSLTWIGDELSLDAIMKNVNSIDPALHFFSGSKGVETLFSTVNDISNDIVMRLFEREKIAKIHITGNKRIEDDAIRRNIAIKPGDAFIVQRISEDLKKVYAMGFFEDIRVEAENSPKGKVILFRVKEKRTIRHINIKGNAIFDDDKIKENLDITTGEVVNNAKVDSNVKRIKDLYIEKNYHNTEVSYKLYDKENNQADIEFTIKEGKKIKIKSITFEGNSDYDSKELKKVMKTSEKGFFSWLTSSGELKMDTLNRDIELLTAFYQNSGYINARVSDPQVEYSGEWIYIKIKVDEDKQFKVGKMDFTGDLEFEKDELLSNIKIDEESIYSRDTLQKDIIALTDLYSDKGYAKADIFPNIAKNNETLDVDITFNIKKGKKVYFEKIVIHGNTKTRDKVIRRELKVIEQELFSGKKLKRSVRNLHRLDYFSDIKVNKLEGSSEDKMILDMEVVEKTTGALSFGGGYSSVDNLFFMASVTQRNLFGKGQTLNFKTELGGSSNRYSINFIEPWLFDIPLSAGLTLFNWTREYDDYDKESVGGSIRLGYPVFDYTRAYISYSYEDADYSDIDFEELEDEEKYLASGVTSSVSTTLKYDSRDKSFNATEGSIHSLTVQYAGDQLGGDIAFTKYTADTGWYIPLFWGTVGFVHGRVGYLEERLEGDQQYLVDERFYLGGINSLRGFDYRDVSPVDEAGDRIGGDKFMQFNIEYLFPLIKDVGLTGLIFYDTGHSFNNDEDFEFESLRSTAGYGIRWYSPIGPIRLEYGKIIDKKDTETDDDGRWEFSMGAAF